MRRLWVTFIGVASLACGHTHPTSVRDDKYFIGVALEQVCHENPRHCVRLDARGASVLHCESGCVRVSFLPADIPGMVMLDGDVEALVCPQRTFTSLAKEAIPLCHY